MECRTLAHPEIARGRGEEASMPRLAVLSLHSHSFAMTRRVNKYKTIDGLGR